MWSVSINAKGDFRTGEHILVYCTWVTKKKKKEKWINTCSNSKHWQLLLHKSKPNAKHTSIYTFTSQQVIIFLKTMQGPDSVHPTSFVMIQYAKLHCFENSLAMIYTCPCQSFIIAILQHQLYLQLGYKTHVKDRQQWNWSLQHACCCRLTFQTQKLFKNEGNTNYDYCINQMSHVRVVCFFIINLIFKTRQRFVEEALHIKSACHH